MGDLHVITGMKHTAQEMDEPYEAAVRACVNVWMRKMHNKLPANLYKTEKRKLCVDIEIEKYYDSSG